jgi:SAM-dependent methyltransferase
MASQDPYSAAIAANRAAWDDSAPFHRGNAAWQQLVKDFRRPGFTTFDGVGNPVKRALLQIGVEGRDIAQACCNNGRETLSLKAMGARRAVGFDQSAGFLKQAEELADLSRLACEFVLADINSIPAAYRTSFDLVLITIGVFGWMPDLNRFMRSVADLLRPDGVLLVYEEHPVANMFEPTAPNPMEAVHSYFKPQPFQSKRAIVYYGEEAPEVHEHFWFVHPLSSVMTAMIDCGLMIERFQEFGDNISSVEFDALQKAEPILPLSYLLQARKRSAGPRGDQHSPDKP